MRRAIVLCFLLLWPAAARAEWLQASSAHFVVYSDDSERNIRRFSDRLERYHSAMAFITGTELPDPSPSNRVTIYVVDNTAQVRKLYGGDNRFLGGFYVPRAGGSLAIVPKVSSFGAEPTFSMITLLHEYAHHFMISNSTFPMPRWMSEGGAEFMASASFESNGTVEIGKPAMHRAAELLLPEFARDVVAGDLLDSAAYEKRKSKAYDAFYGKSWLLYHYLTFDDARKGQFAKYNLLLIQGKSSRQAGLEAFGDMAQLEKDLDAYLKKRQMLQLKLTPDLLKTEAIAVRRLSAGEGAIMPVMIRSRVGVDDDQAKALLVDARKIAAKFPADPAVLSALAESEHDADHDAEAIAAADAALAIDPGQVNAYIQKGISLMRLAENAPPAERSAAYSAAFKPFQALNKIEADHPLPLIYNFRVKIARGLRPDALAMRGLERAAEIAPFDLGLRMNLAMAQIQMGQGQKARNNLTPVAYNPHGGELAQAAQAAIARLDADPKWDGSGLSSVQGVD